MIFAAVFYATRYGQARRVAEHIAGTLRANGFTTDIADVRRGTAAIDWPRYSIACLVASVHFGKHEREMVAFATRHRAALAGMRAVFVSISLSEAGAEDVHAPPALRERAAGDVRKMIDTFIRRTGWRPAIVQPVAGALAYTRYNFLVKYLAKRIARASGASTDTSRDRDLTDWAAVERLAADLCRVSGRVVAGPSAPC